MYKTENKYEQALIAHIKRNLDSDKPLFYVNVTHVSQSGMTRRMKVYIIKNNRLLNITSLVGEVTEWGVNDQGVRVGGCGMDMCFHMLDTFVSLITKSKRGYETRAVNNYNSL